MIEFKDCFEKIFIISLDSHADRRARLLSQLKEQGVYEPQVEVIRACHGDTVGVPIWWKAGGGAWGCLQSHSQVIQRAALDGLENFLVLEADAILSDNFDIQLQEAWPSLPVSWQQLYLGGQNLLEPVSIDGFWTVSKDVNRTHAYALKKEVYREVYEHINYVPDYLDSYERGYYPHVDHQLGRAHRRGDWNVVGMETWLFGQGENHSWINGRWHPAKWWDWAKDDCFRFLPYIIVEEDGLFSEVRGDHWRGKNRKREVAKGLHFGWDLGPDQLSTVDGWSLKDKPAMLAGVIESVAREAFDCRRLPAFHGSPSQVSFLRRGWPGGTSTLAEIGRSGTIPEVIEKMRDYPRNGILNMTLEGKTA